MTVLILVAEFKLHEFRSLIEKIFVAEGGGLSRLVKSCPEFVQSNECFLDCQGRLVSICLYTSAY